jgi:hypothetical protein
MKKAGVFIFLLVTGLVSSIAALCNPYTVIMGSNENAYFIGIIFVLTFMGIAIPIFLIRKEKNARRKMHKRMVSVFKK